ncbi:hypothetical protein D9M69_722370 [compost metagenome]
MLDRAVSVTPVRSFRVLKGMPGRSEGLMTCEVTTMPSVWPSGADLATKSVPSTVPAPALYSMITGWPQIFCRSTSSMRARMSMPPPGTLGTMILTGLVGHWLARAGQLAAPALAAMPASSSCRL